MEDSTIITCLRNFDSVWERVTRMDAASEAECGIMRRCTGRQHTDPEHRQSEKEPEKANCRSGSLPLSGEYGCEECMQSLHICRGTALSREVTLLRGFMDAQRGREAGYRAMCSSPGGRCGMQLRALANGCAAMIKEMQLEHFLITGDTWVPAGGNVAAGRGLSRLRALYIDELLAGNEYALQAAASEIEALKLMYGRFSELCTDRASAIRALIAEAIK